MYVVNSLEHFFGAMGRCSILHKMKSLNPTSDFCKEEELCLQQPYNYSQWPLNRRNISKFLLRKKQPISYLFWMKRFWYGNIGNFRNPKPKTFFYWRIHSTKNKPYRKKTIFLLSISPDSNISVMVLQNFTRVSIDFVINNWWVVIFYACNSKTYFLQSCVAKILKFLVPEQLF